MDINARPLITESELKVLVKTLTGGQCERMSFSYDIPKQESYRHTVQEIDHVWVCSSWTSYNVQENGDYNIKN